VGKIANNSLKECDFVNSALKIQCRIVKNPLLQTAFSAILPLGITCNQCIIIRLMSLFFCLYLFFILFILSHV